jgi:hypothetical protein
MWSLMEKVSAAKVQPRLYVAPCSGVNESLLATVKAECVKARAVAFEAVKRIQHGRVLDFDDIVALVKAGVSDQAVVSYLKSLSDAEFHADFKNAIRFIRASIFTKISADNNMTKSCRRHREILTVSLRISTKTTFFFLFRLLHPTVILYFRLQFIDTQMEKEAMSQVSQARQVHMTLPKLMVRTLTPQFFFHLQIRMYPRVIFIVFIIML